MTLYFVLIFISTALLVLTLVERWGKPVEVKDDNHLRVESKHLDKALNQGFSTLRGGKQNSRGQPGDLSSKRMGVRDETNTGQ